MICSSRNRLFRMTPPFKESHNNWIRFRGSLHIDDYASVIEQLVLHHVPN